jgi:hypothetical protein
MRYPPNWLPNLGATHSGAASAPDDDTVQGKEGSELERDERKKGGKENATHLPHAYCYINNNNNNMKTKLNG